MGRVYEAGRISDGLRTAVKILHANIAKDSVAVERFKREFQTAEELDHPHVVRVFDFGETHDGSWFLAMEYLNGQELSQRLKDGPLPLAQVVRLAGQIASALDQAHSFGVIHRDLKPDNIFLAESDSGDDVRLLDFGAVKLQMETGPKLTAYGTTIGSPYYMSPEQAMGKQDVDQRTDVFALSAIVYEMLTGEVAFGGDNVAQILMKIVHEPTPLPSFAHHPAPTSLDDVMQRGCAKDKADRYAGAGELAAAVRAALGLQGDEARWLGASEHELAEAIGAAASSPTGTPSMPVDAVAPVVPPPATSPRDPGRLGSLPAPSSPPLPTSSGPMIVLLLGVVGLGIAVAAAAAALFLF